MASELDTSQLILMRFFIFYAVLFTIAVVVNIVSNKRRKKLNAELESQRIEAAKNYKPDEFELILSDYQLNFYS